MAGPRRALPPVQLDPAASTTSLADRHGHRTSGVSGHLLALRDAGLITATRHGHELRYARTGLGTALVRAATP